MSKSILNPIVPPQRPGFAERGGWWVVAQTCLMTAIAIAGFWRPGADPVGWIRWSAPGFGALGALVGILGALHLGKNRTAYPKPLEDGELIQTGIYGWIRHPLYSSLILLGTGWALWRWSAWAGLAALGMTLLLDAKARREEVWLLETYPAYAAYRRRVRRFFPYLY